MVNFGCHLDHTNVPHHNGANGVNGAHMVEGKEMLILMHNVANGVNGAPMEERKEMHYGEC